MAISAMISHLTKPRSPRYGRKLKRICSSIKDAGAEPAERALPIDNVWLHLANQLSFASRVEQQMDDDHREIYAHAVRAVEPAGNRLASTRTTAEAARQWFRRHRATAKATAAVAAKSKAGYALRKDSLDKAIEELEVW